MSSIYFFHTWKGHFYILLLCMCSCVFLFFYQVSSPLFLNSPCIKHSSSLSVVYAINISYSLSVVLSFHLWDIYAHECVCMYMFLVLFPMPRNVLWSQIYHSFLLLSLIWGPLESLFLLWGKRRIRPSHHSSNTVFCLIVIGFSPYYLPPLTFLVLTKLQALLRKSFFQ